MLNAVRTAARGEVLIQPEMMARLVSYAAPAFPAPLQGVLQHPSDANIPGSIALTRREKEVLAGVARGERSKEIAVQLGITERTVRAYLTNIYTKLNMDSRASAVAVALAHGLLPHEGSSG